jgi:uncharacterized protein (TIGR04255 family)
MNIHKVVYPKPFLKEVIVRLDFSTAIGSLATQLPAKISNSILKRFPVLEPKKVQAKEFEISGSEITTRTADGTEWTFYGKEREKKFVVVPSAAIVSVKKYVSYESLKADLEDPLKVMSGELADLRFSRIGLRYVNVIEMSDGDPLSWAEYVNEKILGIIDFHEEKQYMSRAFHILEYNFDGQALKFQFGIINPDYPAVIRKRHFVLDLDSYFHGAYDFDQVWSSLDAAHEKIQSFFEKSITDKTRTLMGRSAHG